MPSDKPQVRPHPDCPLVVAYAPAVARQPLPTYRRPCESHTVFASG
jgi:hypothetical protein